MLKNKKNYFVDVVIIRLSLIFYWFSIILLPSIQGIGVLPFHLYRIYLYTIGLSVCTHGFQLEAMTFISGLLLGYTIKRHPERLSFHGCVIKKIKRILLPCFIFSFIYFLIFNEKDMAWYESMYEIIIGCGHLWYLPMIFWCFVLLYYIEAYSSRSSIKLWLPISFLFCLLPLSGFLPLRIGYTTNFFIYFYIGYVLMKYNLIKSKKLKISYCFWGMLTYFFIGIILKEWVMRYEPASLIMHGVQILLMRLFHLVGALSMIVVFYIVSNIALVSNYIAKHPCFVILSGYCYGVYIYQQFILLLIYFYTNIPEMLGPIVLPWVACAVTIILSLLMCHLTLKTRFGRFLIG